MKKPGPLEYCVQGKQGFGFLLFAGALKSGEGQNDLQAVRHTGQVRVPVYTYTAFYCFDLTN